MEHYKKIRIEGFGIDRLIDRCNKNRIPLRNLRMVSDLEITLTISNRDFKKLKKLAKNIYRITIIKEGGYKHIGGEMRKRKVTLIGVAIFIAFIYYQSLFIVEIQVDGYEKIGERQIRQTMREMGLYEGARKNIDVEQLKVKLYESYDEISWVGIQFVGRLAKVKVVEGAVKADPKVGKKKPCNIVAKKDGYVERIIPIEGIRVPDDGDYVKKGDVLIAGKVPLASTAYGTEHANDTETYVHAAGSVKLRVPEHFTLYCERYERIKTKTGSKLFGISINGHNSAKDMNNYESSIARTKNIVNIVKPFPIKIDVTVLEEVKLTQRELSGAKLKKAVDTAIREFVKENLPEKTEILNKSLKFTREKNIMSISVTIETLQEIGIEQEIAIDKSDKKDKEDKPQ